MIVFLSGLGDPPTVWDGLRSMIPLKSIAIEWPADQPKTLMGEAEFVRRVVGKKLVVLVAHSIGTRTALMYQQMYGVRGLVLIDPPKLYPPALNAEYQQKYLKDYERVLISNAGVQLLDWDAIRDSDNIIVHVNIVPPETRGSVEGADRVAEHKIRFKNVITHYGATHHIMHKEPKPIIASIMSLVGKQR